jgi:hypothetical protein
MKKYILFILMLPAMLFGQTAQIELNSAISGGYGALSFGDLQAIYGYALMSPVGIGSASAALSNAIAQGYGTLSPGDLAIVMTYGAATGVGGSATNALHVGSSGSVYDGDLLTNLNGTFTGAAYLNNSSTLPSIGLLPNYFVPFVLGTPGGSFLNSVQGAIGITNGNTLVAPYFQGDGSKLTGISGGSGGGTNFASITVTNNVNAGTFSGNGFNVTNLNPNSLVPPLNTTFSITNTSPLATWTNTSGSHGTMDYSTGNATNSGTYTASGFIGNGGGLTNTPLALGTIATGSNGASAVWMVGLDAAGKATTNAVPSGDGSGGGGSVTNQLGSFSPVDNIFSVKQFGAYGDGVVLTNVFVAAGSSNLFCPTSPFSTNDVGLVLEVWKVGTTNVDFVPTNITTTIAAFINPSNVQMGMAAVVSNGMPWEPGTIALKGHDDTSAFQALYNYLVLTNTQIGSSGYVPYGNYIINGGFTNVLSGEPLATAQIVIPVSPNRLFLNRSILLYGATPPAMSADTATFYAPFQGGTVIWSTRDGTGAGLLSQGGTNGCAIIATSDAAGGATTPFNAITPIFRNLTFVAKPDPKLVALNMLWAANLEADHLVFNTGIAPGGITNNPSDTDTGSCAIITPALYNGGDIKLTSIDVSGFRFGYATGEHTCGDNLGAYSCDIGFVFLVGSAPEQFTQLRSEHNRVPFLNQANGTAGPFAAVVNVQTSYIEAIATGWNVEAVTFFDQGINSATHLHGQIGYVHGAVGTGPDHNFTSYASGGSCNWQTNDLAK